MFKLKTSNNFDLLKQKLNYIETTNYSYIIADDVSLFEDGKINILFDPALVHEVKQLMDLVVDGKEEYLVGYNSNGQKRVLVNDFLYFEVMGHNLYGVLADNRLEINMKLYELEELLKEDRFIRIHKSFIVNVAKINYIRPLLNYKLELEMINNDTLEVTRTYIKEFKNILKI